jgi:hypothetical protein
MDKRTDPVGKCWGGQEKIPLVKVARAKKANNPYQKT